MAYHTRCVARGNRSAWVIGDLPFGSYQESREQALRSATALMQAGAQMVKLEGGGWTAETVRFLVERGIPVCAHLGLTPQSVHALGGYRIQGRDEARRGHPASSMRASWPTPAPRCWCSSWCRRRWAPKSRRTLPIPVIGIGAGAGCSGQVLVLHDMLGAHAAASCPRFVRNFMAGSDSIEGAVRRYVAAVKDGSFPDADARLLTGTRPMDIVHTVAELRRAAGAARSARPSCRRWATCTRATWRCFSRRRRTACR